MNYRILGLAVCLVYSVCAQEAVNDQVDFEIKECFDVRKNVEKDNKIRAFFEALTEQQQKEFIEFSNHFYVIFVQAEKDFGSLVNRLSPEFREHMQPIKFAIGFSCGTPDVVVPGDVPLSTSSFDTTSQS